ncbi:hypothetical protein MSMAW_1765 [Methanosarcina mazei WWM610]|jgi:hypothetical protein|uniref:Uncharacterized protein n=4 Tax=Methanosarcina mazei TaxID=2209 RepID=A0A0F8JUG3_METMZ|nr:hypothetical protein MSMAW_1765 [Methanosarcina mazei WWM610]AKB65047.1 hypothetical protein MSMAS_1851 [Methanosarcina mazei S-6]AKB71157.1 hypothetical protein MSMAC_1267 [Methanosarcina mazei C16]KKG18419.1 hypothetical protein DU34_13685 [Methanosarcina mazei]KKG28775.1 hypothetical protein DU52_05970 [Methanosarcina mazei]
MVREFLFSDPFNFFASVKQFFDPFFQTTTMLKISLFKAPGNYTLDAGEWLFRKSCKKGEFPEFKKSPKNQLKPEITHFNLSK